MPNWWNSRPKTQKVKIRRKNEKIHDFSEILRNSNFFFQNPDFDPKIALLTPERSQGDEIPERRGQRDSDPGAAPQYVHGWRWALRKHVTFIVPLHSNYMLILVLLRRPNRRNAGFHQNY